ncbi:MAG: hypothetical protein ACI9VF_003419 [Alteromonas macleodii]
MPNSEVKRISADGSVGLPHVRVGHCQVPIKETRLTAGFLRLEERKKMGSEYINPHSPQQNLKLGSEYFITLNIRT